MTPFDKEKRRTFTPRQRAQFFAERGGKCENCGRQIRAGEVWQIDHKQALTNQGSNEDSNLQLLCQVCHGGKTPKDRRQAAEAQKKFTNNIVPRAKRKGGFRGWRKFDGTPVYND